MSNLVIVAIPDENDPVWKVSSEKVPHMTILFLGDVNQVANLDQIMLFVEHAASTTLNRFYMTVDRRGVLGADEADVLFFKKNFDYKAVRDFRAALLQDNNIRTAYDSAQQFEGPWNPHLTLGYPTAPAKPIPDNQLGPFYSVSFDRIAVWTNDFEGPEFQLTDFWDEYETMTTVPMDVAMSGIRHAATVSDTPWGNFKDSDYTDEQYARACLLDRGADAGTAKQRYSLPVREPDGTLNRNGCHAAAAVLSSTGGTGSARGNKIKNATDAQVAAAKKKLIALYNGPLNEDVPEGLGGGSVKQTVDLGAEFVSHQSVLDNPDLAAQIKAKIQSILDDITGDADKDLTLFGDPLIRTKIQSVLDDFYKNPNVDNAMIYDALGAAFVEHYGIKGMHWGVRKEAPTASTPQATSQVSAGLRNQTKIKTSGGENHPAHEDALRVAKAQIKLKKSGMAALSNNELRDVSNRIQLEQQVKGLMTSRGRKFASRQLETAGQQTVQRGVARGIGKAAVKKGGTAALLLA